MRLLVFDTCLEACSAAVVEGDAVLAARSEILPRGHAERLVPMLAEVLMEAGLTAAEIDAFAVTVGPGSFVGVRVGVAAARGLALAHGRPALGVSTLAALAQVPGGRPLLAAIDARRGEVYAQCFDALRRPLGEAAVLSAATAAEKVPDDCLLTGSAAGLIRSLLRGRCAATASVAGAPHPEPRNIAGLALAALAAGERGPPRPLYLRPPDAKLPAA